MRFLWSRTAGYVFHSVVFVSHSVEQRNCCDTRGNLSRYFLKSLGHVEIKQVLLIGEVTT